MEAMAQGQEAYLWFTRAADDPWTIFGTPCAVRVSRNVYGCEAGKDHIHAAVLGGGS